MFMDNLILLTAFIWSLCFVFAVGALCEVLLTKRKHRFFDYKL